MRIAGRASVRCPACGREQEGELIQSINAQTDPEAKAKLLAGELNMLACACGKRAQLAAKVVYVDPARDWFCQVCPGGEAEIAQAVKDFEIAGTGGTRRIVPSLNALVEKVKLIEAGLEDWAIEMTKVLLLAASGGADLDRVLLFESVERAADVIHWVRFDEDGVRPAASPFGAYAKLAARTHAAPGARELQIDRAWAVEAVREMIAAAN
jgi:hypothetical protein